MQESSQGNFHDCLSDGAALRTILKSYLTPCAARIVLSGAGRPRGSLLRSQHHHERAHLHPAVEIDHILIGQPDAARRNRMSNPSGLVRAVDAIQRIVAACVEVERTRTHWIACTAFDIVRKRAESPLLALGRRPSGPFFLAADCGHAGPSLSILAHD